MCWRQLSLHTYWTVVSPGIYSHCRQNLLEDSFFSTRGHLYPTDTTQRAWNLSCCYMLKLRWRKCWCFLKALIWVSYAIARFIRFATKHNYHYVIVLAWLLDCKRCVFYLYFNIMHSFLYETSLSILDWSQSRYSCTNWASFKPIGMTLKKHSSWLFFNLRLV